MRPSGPTFWLLDGATGWRTGHTDNVSVGAKAGIRLAADPAGPLALNEPNGSLGNLTLPRYMALDQDNTLYLLSKETIRRFDPAAAAFVPLPAVGGRGREARQFYYPANIACAGDNLYVADWGNRRMQVFDRRSLALLYVWTFSGLRPLDVAAYDRFAYILLDRHGQKGQVYRHRAGSDRLTLLVDRSEAVGRWTRLAVDRHGFIHLFDPSRSRLDRYDEQGNFIESVDDAGDVRGSFDRPPVRLDHRDRFCLPAGLARECDRRKPDEPCLGTSPDALVFNIQGQRLPAIDPLDTLGPRPYLKDGIWISEPLDSETYACQWHRIVAELSELPPGNRVTVSTYSSEELRATGDILNLPAEMWDTKATVSGEMQPPAEIEEADGSSASDFLVQSREGRYLWLKLALQGDGYETPAIHSLRVHYPRSSYLEYMPAVFAADDESRWFLERFLSIVQSDWDGLEEEIEHIRRYFDPRAVPAGEALEYLASWLALPLEGDWTQEQKRNLLAAAPGIYPKRGTAESLRRYLQIYLQNMTGLSPAGQRGYPRLVEGFRERRFAMLATGETSRLGLGAPLWGPGLVGRLQLDVFATEGEVRLVSTGDPERDVFHEYAHRFRVFLPAAWIRTAEDERMIRRALEAEKPAHTQYDLCLVEPRVQVGLQSTVGLDTIIGDYPVTRLGTPCMDGGPPSRPPRHRLGYDTILGGIAAGSRQTEVGPSTRVGMETIIG